MNRLARERSPYLLQHAANPVDWYPWGEEAFERARRENKPIFLSIGYSTCHWCHVMEHESFESPEVAGALNDAFVSIKVDREERPDVDRVYMTFVQSTTGSGGWPMTVFLTPELKPFFGGTYFPPHSKWGRPGFMDLIGEIGRVLPPSEYPIFDIPPDHAIMHTLYDVKDVEQVSNIRFWMQTRGNVSERGYMNDSPHVNFRGIQDARGRLMVVMAHNTDIPDTWEREGESKEYFDRFSPNGYAIGVNIMIYAMTH